MTVDLALAGAAFFLACSIMGKTPGTLFPFLALWGFLLYALGMYESFRIKRSGDILLTIWAAAFIGFGLFGCTAYFLQLEDLNRFFVILIFFAAGIFTSLEKLAAVKFLQLVRRKGYNFRRILVVGTGPRARKFMNLVKHRSEWGLQIVGLVDENPDLVGKDVFGLPVLGTLEDVAQIVHSNVVDEIMFIIPRSWFPRVERMISFCETEGIRAHIAIDIFDFKFLKARQSELENFLLLSFERTPIKVGHLFLKAVFDLLISGCLLVILSPLFLAVAIAVKMTSKGPVLYRQTRCGLNGREFTLYKFRTMMEGAETMLAGLIKDNEMKGPVFKLEHDPRITRLGKILRKFSIDELPQLWNVLKREMSIVGPRPPLPGEVRQYDSWQRRRLSMRPGITCLWQVQGRNKITDFDKWAQLDLQYIDHWSLWSDLRIFLRTIPIVILGVGAR